MSEPSRLVFTISNPAATGENTACAAAQVNTVVAAGETSAGNAVWKCKARVSAKDAARARERLDSATSVSTPLVSTPPALTPGEREAGREAAVTVWRCTNTIVPEEKLLMALDRALALLPREIENIRLIREECLSVLAGTSAVPASPTSRAAGTKASRGEVEHSADEHSSRRAEAQILLLHTETALKWLAHASTLTSGGAGTSGAGKDGLPCTTFQQFVERSSASLSSTVEKRNEAIGLLIEKVVVDGEQIKVRFKAGVEI